MNIILIAVLGILPFQKGKAVFEGPQHIVAIQVNSEVSSGNVKLESVESYFTLGEVSHPETNVVNVVSNIPYSVTNVYDVITNVVGGVTNYIDVVTNVVGGVTNVVDVFTNVIRSARRVESSITNVTTVTQICPYPHWVTNVLLDVTLSGGKYSTVTNIYLPVSRVYLSGTATTNGIVNVFVDDR